MPKFLPKNQRLRLRLEGIDKRSKLRVLDVSYMEIEDLSFLKDLQLQKLNISRSSIGSSMLYLLEDHEMPSLNTLRLFIAEPERNTDEFSPSTVQWFRDSHPSCAIKIT